MFSMFKKQLYINSAKNKGLTKKDKSPVWVIIDFNTNPVCMKCTRCGDTYTYPSNCLLNFAIDVKKSFLKWHKKCEEK